MQPWTILLKAIHVIYNYHVKLKRTLNFFYDSCHIVLNALINNTFVINCIHVCSVIFWKLYIVLIYGSNHKACTIRYVSNSKWLTMHTIIKNTMVFVLLVLYSNRDFSADPWAFKFRAYIIMNGNNSLRFISTFSLVLIRITFQLANY